MAVPLGSGCSRARHPGTPGPWRCHTAREALVFQAVATVRRRGAGSKGGTKGPCKKTARRMDKGGGWPRDVTVGSSTAQGNMPAAGGREVNWPISAVEQERGEAGASRGRGEAVRCKQRCSVGIIVQAPAW
jgi:hypothetical protein